ncbi:MAG: DUF1553 domain-containing protein, partial [Verrucomicrobiota bacterium]
EVRRQQSLNRLAKEKDKLSREIRAALVAAGLAKEEETEHTLTFIRDAREGEFRWEYTMEKPSPDWSTVGFRDKTWYRGHGGFGQEGTPNAVVRTPWDTSDIWMRGTFGLQSLPETLSLEIHHDEDVEIYLNGTLIFEAKGYTRDYQVIPLGEKALAALQTGRNVIAVHCRQTSGGQYIDLALRTRSAKRLDLDRLFSGRPPQNIKKAVDSAFERDVIAEYKSLLNQLQHWRTAEAGVALNVATEHGSDPEQMHVHLRGSAHAYGDPVDPGIPAVLAEQGSEPHLLDSAPVEVDGRISSGRRLSLAHWMVGQENPLTARVMVNRFWQHLFGKGIVESSSDFGSLGVEPTHPELLDYLAARFRDEGWGMKDMIRLIVESRTYRLSSVPHSGNLQVDPLNQLLWRHEMRRLTAEELRDSILAVSGKLNLDQGGPWVFPPLPREVIATASRPDKAWPISKDEGDHYRRSIYVHVKRSLRHQMLADFDQADTDSACAVRFVTTVPTQALGMMNSRFMNDQAALLSERLRAEPGEVREQFAAGMRLALQREPDAGELDELMTLYTRLQEEIGLSPEHAFDRVALLKLNLNEFVYLD